MSKRGLMQMTGTKKAIFFISAILVVSMLCGCTGPTGFQDVQNIAFVEYSYDDPEKYNYSFDLDRGVFSADCLEEPEYELEQSEIDAIRSSIEPAGKWDDDFKFSYLTPHYSYYQSYNIVIKYADGTSCVLTGSSENGGKWPDGFVELKATLDGIVQSRL